MQFNTNYSKILEDMRKFFLTHKTKDINFRITALKKLKNTILKHEQDILCAVKKDLGKSDFEAYSSEIGFVLHDIDYQLKNIKKFSKPIKVKTPLINMPGKSFIVKEPYGVALIISPWNYPFQLLISPLIGAIASGNCAILKPSEISENTAIVINKIISETFDENYIKVIEGDAKTSSELLNLKFDYIFYTGSTAVGKIVMQKAAENLTPVTLELGGKSPTIVDKTANITTSARRIVWAKFLNSGQTCIAPDYLYVHSEIKEELIQKLKEIIEQFYTIRPIESKDYSRIISNKHFNRLKDLLSNTKIIKGGSYDREKLFIEPTLIEGDWESKIMQEEIFGPILPIFEYNNEDKLIEKLNSLPKPLAMYIYSNNNNTINNFIKNTSTGGMAINDSISHIIGNMPFGGVGDSGMGSYHGKQTFDTFTHKKSILKRNSIFDPKLRYPPYKFNLDKIKKLMKLIWKNPSTSYNQTNIYIKAHTSNYMANLKYKGILYKSTGEYEIAKFLDKMDILFEYEFPIAVVDDSKTKIWYPDFYLKEYQMVIEYFGMYSHNKQYRENAEYKKEVYKTCGVQFVPIYDLRPNWEEYLLKTVLNFIDYKSNMMSKKIEKLEKSKKFSNIIKNIFKSKKPFLAKKFNIKKKE